MKFLVLAAAVVTLNNERLATAAPPDKAAERALAELTSFHFVDVPISNAVRELSTKHNVTMTIDEQGLNDFGIPGDEPINLIVEGITLRSALNLILGDLGLVATPADEGGLLITTQEQDDERLDTRRYDLRPIFGRTIPDANQVINLFTACTNSDWESIDGVGGTIDLSGTTLSVHQTDQAHREIAGLIVQMTRVVNPRQAPPVSLKEKNERALRQKLSQPVKVAWVDAPLADAIDDIARLADVTILLDVVAFSDSGIPTDEPINLPETEQPVADILDLILLPLGLAWLIENEILRITTEEVASETLTARVFDVRRRVRQAGSPQQLIEQIQGLEAAGEWETIDGIGGSLSRIGGMLVILQSEASLRAIEEFLGTK